MSGISLIHYDMQFFVTIMEAKSGTISNTTMFQKHGIYISTLPHQEVHICRHNM